ncbi:MAG: hypothetical protein ACP5UV_01480 [Thermoplasmata archaeon]
MTDFILADTNVIIYAVKKKIWLDEAVLSINGIYEVRIPDCVIKELYGLSKDNSDARAALAYALRKKTVRGEGRGDDCILDAAIRSGSAILTNDRKFIEIIKKRGIRAAVLRGKTVLLL